MSDFLNRYNKEDTNRPDRVSDIESRPLPERQDNTNAQPWFVSEDPGKSRNPNAASKKIVKRSVSILFPIIGIGLLIIALAFVIVGVAGLYE